MDLSKWSDLIADWEYYRAHQSELLKEYEGKVLVLHEKQVAGAFSLFQDAVDFGIKHFGMGKFLVQECSQGEKDLEIKLFSGLRF